MLQQIFLFLADYTVICVQSLPLTVVSDTLSGKLMDGNFGCCPALVRLLFKCNHNFNFSWATYIYDSKQEYVGIAKYVGTSKVDSSED